MHQGLWTVDTNRTGADHRSVSYNLAELFERVADAVPDREAVVSPTSRRSYAQLDTRATRLAHAFAARGIGPGDHIGLQLHNGVEYLEAMLAAYKLRAVPVNVNCRYVEPELAYLYDDADLVALVYHRALAPVSRRCSTGHRSCVSSSSSTTTARSRRSEVRPTTSRRSPPGRLDATSANVPATTCTSRTPAARRAGPRESCGATRTSSSRRWAAATRRPRKDRSRVPMSSPSGCCRSAP